MSEIYLTKIERKTIFTKSLIFVLIMFIISDLTVTGPFWFNFIPWLYILGTVGSLKKIDSVLMGIIGTFTVFMASTIMSGGVSLTCIFDTVVAFVSLVLGIVTGKILYEFVLEHRLVKYIRRRKKTMYIIAIVVMFLGTYLIVGLNSGNIFAYLKSKSNLKEYITNTYNIQDYDIIQTKYNKQVPGKYTYKVKINEQEVYFVPLTEEIFKDANKDARYEQVSKKLEQEVSEKTEKTLAKFDALTDTTVHFNLEYNDFTIDSETIVLTIQCNTETQEQDMDRLYEQLANCIKELQTVKQSQRIVIKVNDKTLQLSYEKLDNLDKDYIKGGFQIEELSD